MAHLHPRPAPRKSSTACLRIAPACPARDPAPGDRGSPRSAHLPRPRPATASLDRALLTTPRWISSHLALMGRGVRCPSGPGPQCAKLGRIFPPPELLGQLQFLRSGRPRQPRRGNRWIVATLRSSSTPRYSYLGPLPRRSLGCYQFGTGRCLDGTTRDGRCQFWLTEVQYLG